MFHCTSISKNVDYVHILYKTSFIFFFYSIRRIVLTAHPNSLYCICLSCDSGGDCECLCTAIAAYAEECNRRGVYIRWRSQELCRMSKTHPALTQPIFCTCIFTPVLLSLWNFCFFSESCCLSLITLCFPPSPQLCSVTMGWFMIPVVQRVLPRVPVFSRVHIHSVTLCPVWRAASVLLAQSYMVKQINQTNPKPLRV